MPSFLQVLHLSLAGLYILTLGILTVYGVHRYMQVFLYYKHQENRPKPAGQLARLPRITVQLPMYNEQYVAQRVIEAACQLDYPRDLLQIQVLDDSTDESAGIARECCRRMRAAGHDVEYIHRGDRTGYKAGALEHGLATATGEFIAIFDSDFVPEPSILKAGIHYFIDPKIGCVQTRWEHLNREQSLLTRCEAVFLDGHFVIEHTARNCSGRFMNFNGTGGIWRRTAIADSGGWQHDTLTEDVDLSYRAQLKGWRFVFLPDVTSPAELPPEVAAFKQQQHRWTKGSVQTAVKLLPTILRAPLPLRIKAEAFFHLTSGIVYLPAVILSLLLYPVWALAAQTHLFETQSVMVAMIVMTFFGLLTCSAGTFYMVSQQVLGRSVWRTALLIPTLMALGMGISVMNAWAVMEGLFGKGNSEFVRTPKYGATGSGDGSWKKRAGVFKRKLDILPFIELALGVYMTVCVVLSVYNLRALGTLPFLMIFAFGYLYVGFFTLQSRWLSHRTISDPPAGLPVPVAEAVAA